MRRHLVACFVALAVAGVQAEPKCRVYKSKGSITPASVSMTDAIVVTDAFRVGDASVQLDLSHRRIGALKVSLTAEPFGAQYNTGQGKTIVIKEQGLGRLGDNMYGTTFYDGAAQPFPNRADPAPFVGSYRPTQRLSFLYDGAGTTAGEGGSQGDWILRIDDVADNATRRSIALNGWTLTLCEPGMTATGQVDVPTPVQPQPVTPLPLPPPSPVPSPSPPPSPAPVEQPREQPRPSPLPAPSVQVPAGAPAPGVQAQSGPSGTQLPPTNVPTTTGSIFGWNVVMLPSEQPAGYVPPPTPAPRQPGLGWGLYGQPALQPGQPLQLQSPLAGVQGTINSYLHQRFGAACTDEACTNIKAQFWRSVFFALYTEAAVDAHHEGKHVGVAFLDRLKDFLPGDNPKLSDLMDWISENHAKLHALKDRLKDKLPALGDLPNLPGIGDFKSFAQTFKNPALLQSLASFKPDGHIKELLAGLKPDGQFKELLAGLKPDGHIKELLAGLKPDGQFKELLAGLKPDGQFKELLAGLKPDGHLLGGLDFAQLFGGAAGGLGGLDPSSLLGALKPGGALLGGLAQGAADSSGQDLGLEQVLGGGEMQDIMESFLRGGSAHPDGEDVA